MTDSAASYDFGIASLREIAIRAGRIKPSQNRPEEARWAAEGPVETKDLDTVREA